jgi:hypothetical protein
MTFFMSQNIYFATYGIQEKGEGLKYVEISTLIELRSLGALLLIMINFDCSVDNIYYFDFHFLISFLNYNFKYSIVALINILDLFHIYCSHNLYDLTFVKSSEFRGFKMRLNERYFDCRVFVPISFIR